MGLFGHRGVVAWQRSMDLAVAAYTFGQSLRKLKHGALASQLQRAVISIPSNIAEGRGRSSQAEYGRFLDISMGSVREVDTVVELCRRVGAGKLETIVAIQQSIDEVGRVLFGLLRAVRSGVETSR